MTRIAVQRVDVTHPGFRALVLELDADLRARYGAAQDDYAVFNGLGDLQTAVVLSDTTAFVACGCFRPFDTSAVELKRMFVRADRRGRGFAGEVLAEIERWVAELGYTSIVLETGIRQDEAIAFYGKHGFVDIPLFGPYVGMTLSRCMQKSL
jgi:putative acetyltransferase